MVDYENLRLMLLAYKQQLYTDYCTVDDTPPTAQEVDRYITDIQTPRYKLHVAMEPDKYFMITQDQARWTYIVDLYVAPAHRQQGIATHLISALNGALWLQCYDTNPAKNLYESLGFIRTSQMTEPNSHIYVKP